ncbi:unnamed protein product [Calicophoron daubneyi]|uniref:Sm domain-containing protein n=1 Tax=Calicophoron daubneyi TaxID=300641 RepID=A0AAV2TE75_CALDB
MSGGLIPYFYAGNTGPDPWIDLVPADPNCTHGIQWIWAFMGQCVIDTRDMIAMLCGFISLCAWIINGIPQIVENFRSGIPDKALSPFMLMFWFLGDICNFIGCALTHQLILQIVVAVYSIANDLILISQFVYFKIRNQTIHSELKDTIDSPEVQPNDLEWNPSQHNLVASEGRTHARGTTTLAVCLLGFVGLTLYTSSSAPMLGSRVSQSSRTYLHPGSRQLLQFDFPGTTLLPSVTEHTSGLKRSFLDGISAKIGYGLGFVSSVMYLSSRFPQIIRNWRRQSTEGVCVYLFCLALLGNTTYALQILLTSLDPMFLLGALPWLIGSIGVLFLDVLILSQFYRYRPHKQQSFHSASVEDAPDSARAPLLSSDASLDKREACENWRARDRLTSSLLAIFPAAMIGQTVTVTLLDETRISGRLTSCDGMLNLVLEGDVTVTRPFEEPIALKEITISGKRVRYVSLPSSLNVRQTLEQWDFQTVSSGRTVHISERLISRPKRSKDKYAYLRSESRQESTSNGDPEEVENRPPPSAHASAARSSKSYTDPKLQDKIAMAYREFGLSVTGDPSLDAVMSQTVQCILQDSETFSD